MSAKTIFIRKLLSVPAVTAIAGNRIYAGKAVQGAPFDYIIVSLAGNENRQLLEGDAGFARARVRVECVGASPLRAENLKVAVFDALKNVTHEVVDDGESPPVFSADATIVPADFETDAYSDVREADVEIVDFYCDWRRL